MLLLLHHLTDTISGVGPQTQKVQVRKQSIALHQDRLAYRPFSLASPDLTDGVISSEVCSRCDSTSLYMIAESSQSSAKVAPHITLNMSAQRELDHQLKRGILNAGGGTRTRTELSPQRILSPLCLPFHHPGEADAFAEYRNEPSDASRIVRDPDVVAITVRQRDSAAYRRHDCPHNYE